MAEPDFEVVGEAADGEQAVQKARLCKPDVVPMDIRMPVLDGLQTTAQILSAGEDAPRVIVPEQLVTLHNYL